MQKVNLQWESFWRDSTLWICARAGELLLQHTPQKAKALFVMTQWFAYCCVGCGR
ncbi:hypothetical protein [Helicobacter sp.]|uniref:hypothetical protein n=1 Tax=Helicobacter sp. TaxID=218 RepID=UPI002A90C577|nr:hypothetical protein [Helicobacter sp.]MCI5632173.1 hypothetical protein [Helicobacter sp.]